MSAIEQWIEQFTKRHGVNGVNVCGYLRTESGVGAAARSYVRALRSISVPTTLCDLSRISGNRNNDRTLGAVNSGQLYDANLICVDVDLHYAALSHLGEDFFRDRYNIGVWWWELPTFPGKWRDRFAYYDEIWAGTSFIANTLAPIAPIPVVRVPPVLTPATTGSRARGRRRLGVSSGEYLYLYVFDFHSHVQRKNPRALIDAFKRAFAVSDPVRLVIKCVNAGSNPGGFASLWEQIEGYPISIYDGYWSVAGMRDLMAACDAYVSLHRSEGAGLTIADAMALGKPVIATGWSGNMDFMNAGNSYPVPYRLVEIQENVGPYQAGEVWAEPSVEQAAQWMRFVFTHRDEADAQGQMARQEIESYYSEAAIGALISQRLEAIALRRRFSAFTQEVYDQYNRYRRLPDRIRESVRQKLPPNSTVLVVSKGDEQLLALDGCTTWHFPRNESGQYAGYYPADSTEAIAHLEELRQQGARYLLLPQTAFWWLDHYELFRQHLEAHYRVVVHAENSCLVFALGEGNRDRADLAQQPGELDAVIMPLQEP